MKKTLILSFLLIMFSGYGSMMFALSVYEIDASSIVVGSHFEHTVGSTFTISADISGAADGLNIDLPDLNWDVCNTCSGSPTCDVLNSIGSSHTEDGIRIERTGTNELSVTNLATRPIGSYSFSIRVLDGSIVRACVEFNFVIRRPFDLFFVLDRSGSMECEPEDHDWDECVAAADADERRWDILKSAVLSFANRLNEPDEILTSDRIGVTYFSGNIVNPDVPLSSTDLSTFIANITDDMGTPPREEGDASPLGRNGTSIGAGLRNALVDHFGGVDPTFREGIVLITDGENNQFPQYNNGANRFENDDGTVSFDLDTYPGIELFTLGIGWVNPIGPMAIPLEDISHGFIDEYDAEGIITLETTIFNYFLRDFSPNYIAFEDQNLKTENIATFTSNRKVTKLLFDANYDTPIAHRCKCKVFYNGVDVTNKATKADVTNKYYKTFTFKFQDINDPNISSEGTWKIECDQSAVSSQITNSKIRLSATADDHNIKIRYSTGKKKLRVNDDMNLTMLLQENGQPIENAKVTATIIKPGDDINHLIATAKGPDNLSTDSEIDGLCGTQRYVYLQKNNPEKFIQLNNRVVKTIDLNYNENGIYKGNYTAVDVSGVYKVIFKIKSISDELGEINRVVERSVNVRFGDISRVISDPIINYFGKREVLRLRDFALTTDYSSTRPVNFVTLRPAYKVNKQIKYVGPGLGAGIIVKDKDNNPINVKVTDKCNGTYNIHFPSGAKKNDKITISLLEDKVYNGKIKNFDLPPRGKFTIRGGGTIPFQQLDTLYNRGYYLEASIGHQFSKRIGIDLVGGYYNFSDKYSIYGGTGYFNIYWINSPNSLSLSTGFGGGYYKPEGLDPTFGYSGRISLEKHINLRWSFLLEGAYFGLIDPTDYAFATFGLGLRAHF